MKEETVMNNDTAKGFGIGLLVGAVIGGVIALLYTPKTGKETRQLIKDKVTELNEVVDAVKGKTTEVVDAVKESASEVSRKGQAAVKAMKS
jgi:gas vesicle protein